MGKPRKLVDYSDSEDEGQHDIRDYYDLRQTRQRASRKLKTTASVYTVDVKEFPEEAEPLYYVSELFDSSLWCRISKMCRGPEETTG